MTTTEAAAHPALCDPDLFRTQAYVDGAWVSADEWLELKYLTMAGIGA